MEPFVRAAGARRAEQLSTGIEGLDSVLGECLTRGTSILLLEDENSQIHSTVLQVFLSEGAGNGERMVAVTKEEKDVEVYGPGVPTEFGSGEKMVIAWRYSELSLRRQKSKFSLAKKTRFEGTVLSGDGATLESVLEIARREKELRIAVFSLLSPAWECSGHGEKEIMRFLFELRKAARINGHVCMVSIPGFFTPGANYGLYFDVVARIESNLFTGLCPNYNVLLGLEKIGGHGCLRVNSLSSLRYGVKVRKEGICVEKIDVPPEESRPRRGCLRDKSF